MAPDGIVFALSNPDPEIHPDVAAKYAAVVATGRSDFPNQINNVLAFPGVFRGALDAGARRITEKMKVAAAEAIFSVVGDDLAVDQIVPSPLDPRVGPAVRRRSRRPRASDRLDAHCRAPARRRAGRLLLLVAVLSTAAAARSRVDRRRRDATTPESTAAGPPVRGGAAVLRHRRACRGGAGPVGRAGLGRIRRGAGLHRPAAEQLRARRDGARRRAGVPRHGVGAARRRRRRRLHQVRGGQARARGHRGHRRRLGRPGRDGGGPQLRQADGRALSRSARPVDGRHVHAAEAARIPGRRNAVRGAAGRADQRGVDDRPPIRTCRPSGGAGRHRRR